ncbi:MAG TPA: hypothetical protein VGU27_04405 [Candidatus Eisenbacteria bacterium]|nr:hypothetical protein [Candidatus Eisenbacteria bacterium]
MKRPVRPVALVILTLCALYPGLTSVFQGLYPWVAAQPFNIQGQEGVFVTTLVHFGAPIWVPNLLKAAIGAAWLAGVPGLWAGDWRAWPLTLLAAVGSLLLGPWPAVMGIVGILCLTVYRETARQQPA